MNEIDAIKENWNSRSPSEKTMLACLAFLMVCVLFYLLVVDPLFQWQESQKRQLSASARVLSQVERLVQKYQQQGEKAETAEQGLIGIINQSLREHGLAMKGFQPGKNNDARLSLSEVQYKPLLRWLYDIEYKYFLTIEEFYLIQTKKAGLLNATIRVRQ